MAGRRRNVNIGANSIVYSGRGRPRTKEIVDRPLPVGIVLGSPSPGSDIFKNRKIRVGGPFQAKVPKKPLVGNNNSTEEEGGQQQQPPIYRTSRKPPSRVSAAYPHLTEDEVEEYEAKLIQQKELDSDPLSQQTQSEAGLSTANNDMEMDTALSSQAHNTGNNNTFTSQPDSSNSIVSNTSGSQKTSTTDRQQEGSCSNNSNDNNNTGDDSVDDGQYNNSQDGDDDDDDGEEPDGELKTERGGYLLCPSIAAYATTATTEKTSTTTTDDQGAFWDYVQPLMFPNEGPYSTNDEGGMEAVENTTPDDTWQSKVLQWHLDKQQRALQLLEIKRKQEEEANSQLPKRRGRKRKKDLVPPTQTTETDENALEWYDHNILSHHSKTSEKTTTTSQQQQQKKQRTSPQTLSDVEEAKAHAMQHFWLRHKGQLATAELETRVQLSAGKADEARKKRAYKRRKETRGNLNETLWRTCCEQSTIPCMTGDYRNNGGSAAQIKRTNAIWAGFTTDSDVVEVQKETWKAILELGRAIVDHLTKASQSSSQVPYPKFPLLLSFIDNANQVRPLPEDIFRAPSMVPEINNCFNQIAEYAVNARKVQSQLMDALYETHHSGIDLDAVQKLLDQQAVKALPVELDDASELRRHLELAADWQTRLDALVGETELCLSSLESLAQEGRSFAFRSKSLLSLENRIQKCYQLRDRIVEWRKACEQSEENLEDDQKESVKFLAAMVRDANKLKLQFPEVSDLLETHRTVEAWIDRANIAIRSRISLKEIKALIQKGDELPVNLSDFLEKLRARVGLAEDWVDSFKDVVPRTDSDGVDPDSDRSLLRWMGGMRDALKEGNHTLLHDLASAGSRIPVEVDIVKLLQIELDGKTWSIKAKKWVPSLADEEGIACKKGKLEDLREHLDKAALLRERLDLSPSERSEWVLEGETEIRTIVLAADDWFEKYKPFLDWDNRRTEGRSCLSIKTLRTIVDEGNSIHANVGSATGKMARILSQAEDWEQKHQALLTTCNIIPQADGAPQSKSFVTLDDMTAAAEAAGSDVSLDLDEAKELIKMVDKVKDWYSRATNAAPKRSKRQSSRGRKAKLTVEDIIGLIKEASLLPVDTSDVVNRLQMQLSAVQEWRAKAREELENIYNGFLKLRHVADEMYGHPQEYTRNLNEKSENSGSETKAESDSGEEKKVTEDMSNCETSSTTGSDEQDSEGMSHLGNGTCNVNQLIKLYRREALTYGVVSGEVEAAEQLDKVSNWCVRSLKYLVTQRDVFDKRFFGAFDRFIAEGRELLTPPTDDAAGEFIQLDDHSLAEKLNASWSAFVSDQLQRLEVLLADREQFISWCNSADELLGAKEKPSLEKLKELTDLSRGFPSVCDMVQKVRGVFNKAMEWKKSTGQLLEEDVKLSRNEAKIVLDEGEKLGFVCDEMKVLRDALRLARNWSNKVKRCNADGSPNSNAVQGLIAEHEKLLIEMPEELSTLQQAMQLYCICRRPYSGFMIGCDECEEWYHGVCIGISESKADRVDKFVCVRCCVSRVYTGTAKEAVSVVKKWTCQKNMKKARKVDEQKHLRKVRKETKEIEKLRAEIETLEKPQEPPNDAAAIASSSQTAAADVSQDTVMTSNPQDSGTLDTIPTQDSDKAANTQDPNKPETDQDKAKPPQPKLSPEEVKAKIESAEESIRKSSERLSSLNEAAEKHKAILSMEDSKAPLLRNWCLRVRSSVLVPRSDESALLCRPLEDGSLSTVMQNLMKNAKELELTGLSDVKAMDNAFKCLAWCLLAASTLARKPSLQEIDLLVSRAKPLKFTEEKALRVIKGIHSRAKAWQGKVLKTLAPSPGEKKPFNLDALKELETSAQDIPVRLKEMSLISSVIEDKGARHCLCGGPSDARFMLGCDKCHEWFHGPCVSMTKQQCDEVQNKKWICPRCARIPGAPSHVVDVASCGILWDEVDDPASSEKATRNLDVAAEAPDPRKMWPPFGLFGSTEALEVLGDECSAIPDAEGIVKVPIVGTSDIAALSSHIPVVTEDGSQANGAGKNAAAELPSTDLNAPGDQPPTQVCQSSSKDAASTQEALKSCVDLPFQWLAQSGDLSQLNAAAMAAAQSMAQTNPPVFPWPQNAIIPMGSLNGNSSSKSEGVEGFNEVANENESIKPSSNGCHEGNIMEASSIPPSAQTECVPAPPSTQADCDAQPKSAKAQPEDASAIPPPAQTECVTAPTQADCDAQPQTTEAKPQGGCAIPPSAQAESVPPESVPPSTHADCDSGPKSTVTETKPLDACLSSVKEDWDKDDALPVGCETAATLPVGSSSTIQAAEIDSESQGNSHTIEHVVANNEVPKSTEASLPETQRTPSPAPIPNGLSLMVAALPVHDSRS